MNREIVSNQVCTATTFTKLPSLARSDALITVGLITHRRHHSVSHRPNYQPLLATFRPRVMCSSTWRYQELETEVIIHQRCGSTYYCPSSRRRTLSDVVTFVSVESLLMIYIAEDTGYTCFGCGTRQLNPRGFVQQYDQPAPERVYCQYQQQMAGVSKPLHHPLGITARNIVNI